MRFHLGHDAVQARYVTQHLMHAPLGAALATVRQRAHALIKRHMFVLQIAVHQCRNATSAGGRPPDASSISVSILVGGPVLCGYGAVHCPVSVVPDGLRRRSGFPHGRGSQAIILQPRTDAGGIVIAAMFVAIAKRITPLLGNGRRRKPTFERRTL